MCVEIKHIQIITMMSVEIRHIQIITIISVQIKRNQIIPIYANDTASLRRQCVEKGLPSHGRRNLLISRLQKHAPTSTQTVENNPTTSVQPDDTRSSLLTEDQLAQIQSLVTRSVEESVAEIASNAARAAVEAMSNSPSQRNSNNSSNAVIASRDEMEVGTTDTAMTQTSNVISLNDQLGQSVPYGNNCHEVPASYIKKIQAGEFFFISLSYCLRTFRSITNQTMP